MNKKPITMDVFSEVSSLLKSKETLIHSSDMETVMEMTEERAREILSQYGDLRVFESGGFDISESVYFNPALRQGEHCVIWVQGLFTSDELEAIAFLMHNRSEEDGTQLP